MVRASVQTLLCRFISIASSPPTCEPPATADEAPFPEAPPRPLRVDQAEGIDDDLALDGLDGIDDNGDGAGSDRNQDTGSTASTETPVPL
ncbi:hypothetical protein KCU62_g420, partial [Aureobasidium sp. EXF-3399]